MQRDLERIFREERGRVTATLIRLFGDIDVAEEAVQESFLVATQRWPDTGLPPNPGGWILTTARNRAIDRVRRESTRHDRHVAAHRLAEPDDRPPDPREEGPVQDDQLRLMFTCCHPALATSAQVALTLRLLGGLETTEIARALTSSPDFLRLGLMLALERRPVEASARAMFLQVRASAHDALVRGFSDLTEGLTPAQVEQLVTFAIAGADGLFIAKEIGGDAVDLPAMFALLAGAIFDTAQRLAAAP